MTVKLKPLAEQVIVITGASSGIGLVTAKQAAAAGAKVLLVARSEEDLRKIVGELRDRGARAEYAVADVADKEALEAAAAKAREAFGGFDAWVNDAGISVLNEVERIQAEAACCDGSHHSVVALRHSGTSHG